MGTDTKQKITDYLSAHPYLNLATVTPDGAPLAHTVGYVSEGATVYFITDKNTRKARNISSNPSVAYTVDEDYKELKSIQGIQMRGKAERVTDNALLKKVFGMMEKKYPYMNELPENPDYVLFRINPVEAHFIDNTVSFGHRDIVTY
ncbi:MAG: pyridoxamine 5'-phosphate oxidase family protein [Thermodesulfovibrionia bacterium]|nr:pyridoxamine 5'-phosphate oxidase family protein [Thermodesulfovibrionia bacterium]